MTDRTRNGLVKEIRRLREQLEYHHTTCPNNLAAGLTGMQDRDTTIATLRKAIEDILPQLDPDESGKLRKALATEGGK